MSGLRHRRQAAPDTWVTLFAIWAGHHATVNDVESALDHEGSAVSDDGGDDGRSAGDRAGGRHKVFSPATRCVPIVCAQNAVPAGSLIEAPRVA
jgi:hypothetical protein